MGYSTAAAQSIGKIVKTSTAIGTATVAAAAIAGFGVYLAQTDATLDDFSRTPSAIDVTGASADVTCNMTLTPIADPLLDAICAMVSPSGEKHRSCLATSAVGNVWSCPITIDADIEQGIDLTPWTIEYVTTRTIATPLLFDKWTHDDILGLGLPGVPDAAALAIDVTSTNADIDAPLMNSFVISPSSVQIGVPITCTIIAVDSGVGIASRGCTFESPSKLQQATCLSYGAVDNCDVEFILNGQAQEPGIWTEVSHFLTDNLGTVNLMKGSSSFTVISAGACTGFIPDYSANNGWSAAVIETSASESVTMDFYLRPTDPASDSGFAFSQTTIVDWSTLAGAIRFDGTPLIEVKGSDGAYRCDDGAGNTTCPAYAANVWYHFVVDANITNGTYTVQVETCNDGLVTIAKDFGFYTGAGTVTSLSYHNIWAGGPLVSDFDLGQMAWSPAACAPQDCAAQGYTCGTQGDTCGGTATPDPCGTCSGLDVCVTGTCCTPDTCASLGATCGIQADNCGGSTADCGSCTLPDVCIGVSCCTPATDCNGGLWVCGAQPDGCGGTQACGSCGGGDSCVNGVCVPPGTNVPYAHVVPADVGVTVGVGVVAPVPTTVYTGTTLITTDGTVVENFLINNCMKVQANNVTFRNVIIDGTVGCPGGPPDYPINFDLGNNGLVEYSKIISAPSGKQFRLGGTTPIDFVTVRNSELTGGQDVFWMNDPDNVLIENNYIHAMTGTTGDHADGLQTNSPRQWPATVTVRGNYWDEIGTSTSPNDILFQTAPWTIYWENNYMRIWGASTLRCWGGDTDTGYCYVKNNVYDNLFQARPSGNREIQYLYTGTGTYRCNRYEDGTFVPQSRVSGGVDNIQHDITNCPAYP